MAQTPKVVRKAKKGLAAESRKLHEEGKGMHKHLSKQEHKKHVKKTLKGM